MATHDTSTHPVDDVIAEHGYYVQAVLPDHATPGYCYSIGLMALGHPELCVAGMEPRLAHRTMAHAFEHIAEGGRYRADRDARVTLGPMRDVALVEVPREATHPADGPLLGIGAWSVRNRRLLPPTPALQICWPVAGRMPWERGERGEREQPVLVDGQPFVRRGGGPPATRGECPLCVAERRRAECRRIARLRRRWA